MIGEILVVVLEDSNECNTYVVECFKPTECSLPFQLITPCINK